MKKIQYLFVLLLCSVLACSDGETDPVSTDFIGSWSGEMRCPPSPISFNMSMNIRANLSQCEECYTVGLSMGGPEDTIGARQVNGELVLDEYIIDEDDSEGTVIFNGRGRLTRAGTLEFDFVLEETSGDNFSYACTTTFTSQ